MALNGTSRKKQALAPYKKIATVSCKKKKKTDANKMSLSLPTLYNPKRPNSLTTVHALTFDPPAISPATCNRIFTISKGLVNMTCDPPACRKKNDTLLHKYLICSPIIEVCDKNTCATI